MWLPADDTVDIGAYLGDYCHESLRDIVCITSNSDMLFFASAAVLPSLSKACTVQTSDTVVLHVFFFLVFLNPPCCFQHAKNIAF